MGVIPGIILLILGLVTAFWGYHLHAFLRFLAGFSVGALFGAPVAFSSGNGGGEWTLLLAPLLVGIVLGIICVVLKKVWVFIECFGYGFVLTALLIVRFSFGELESIKFVLSAFSDQSYVITRVVLPAAIVGCVAGVVGIFIWRIWIIISTGLWGGVFSCIGLAVMRLEPTIAIIAALVISVLGIVCQVTRTGKDRKTAASAQAYQGSWPPQPAPWPGQPQPPQSAAPWPGQPQPSQPAPQSGQSRKVSDEKVPEEQDAGPALFCSRCGNRLKENEVFCPECGNRVR